MHLRPCDRVHMEGVPLPVIDRSHQGESKGRACETWRQEKPAAPQKVGEEATMKLVLARILYRLRGLFEDPRELFEALGVESHDRILEIGCVIGYHTIPLARIATDGRVHAVDIWEEGLAYLKHRCRSHTNVESICCGAEAVELPLSSLDKLVCFDTLHAVSGFDQAVERWADFLGEGGTFLYRDTVSIHPL